MQVSNVLSAEPKPALSRRQRLVGLTGLASLAVLLVGHSVALSVFLWQPTPNAGASLLLFFSWAITFLGLWFVFRFIKTVRAIPEAAGSSDTQTSSHIAGI
jgi:hypothetical protein